MKGAYYTTFGGPEVIQVGDNLEEPQPVENQVLVDVRAAGLNPLDMKTRAGELSFFIPPRFPMIPGNDLAGIVTAVGAAVTRFKPGDRVFAFADSLPRPSWRGFARPGTWAERAVTREDTLAPMPENLSFEEAASIPLAALTAWQALTLRGNLPAAEKVLINGATGGVGIFALQLAADAGSAVTAVTGPTGLETAQSLGATKVLDYSRDRVIDLEGGFDIIYDIATTFSFSLVKKLLAPGGIYISNIASPAGMGGSLFYPVKKLFGFRKKNTFAWVRPSGENLAAIGQLVSEKRLVTLVEKVFPLEEAAAAHRYGEEGSRRGKIVLSLS